QAHPVQYFAPLWRELANRPEVDLTVLYEGSAGATAYRDREFDATIQWDTDLLGGYRHQFLTDDVEPTLARATTRMFQRLLTGEFSHVLLSGYNRVTAFEA